MMSIHNVIQSIKRRSLRLQKFRPWVFVGGFAVIGLVSLLVIKAAVPTASLEPEAGTIAGNASSQQDPSTSGDGFVQFGSGKKLYGVLIADSSHMETDYQAGVRLAVWAVRWDQWEPANGSFNSTYKNQMIVKANAYRARGYKIGISVGLQYPPSWVMSMPNGQHIDQFGGQSGGANFSFSQTVRDEAAAYITDVVQTMGQVEYYRVGLSKSGEMQYPSATSNNWWAFDSYAQGTGAGLPAGVGINPMPGWIPGTATYNGNPVTQQQVTTWYEWYYGALSNAHAWEIDTHRTAGYTGMIQLVAPGTGAGPTMLSKRITDNLADVGYDPFHTVNIGQVWHRTFADLEGHLENTIVDVSSVYDGSGNPRGNTCQAGDDTLSLNSADPWNSKWSSTRWFAYIARKQNLRIMGENPGNNTAADIPSIFNLVNSCNLTGLMWAFDYQLYDGTNASISDYANAISANP